ncbi:MAG: pyridine nucleotide-disulfide oxidoreductase [Candidatus Parabeggiatoa sp. nov. 3]|nr:MAG: pyridine nucleotide-disulfide oxidoreductase [Gammaproteobacteria bacterium]
MSSLKLNIPELTYESLFQTESLNKLEQHFLTHLHQHNPALHTDLLSYRNAAQTFTPRQKSELLIACAKVLETFLADLFGIRQALQTTAQQFRQHDPVFAFKKWFVLRRARRRLSKKEPLESFAELDTWLSEQLSVNSEQLSGRRGPLSPLSADSDHKGLTTDKEHAVALLAKRYLADKNAYADEIEKLTRWCIRALTTPEGKTAVQNWISFRLPQQIDPAHLVPLIAQPNDAAGRLAGPHHTRRQRQGFKLTDSRMSARQIQSELNYCLYCHDHENDFCSQGFPQASPELEIISQTKPDRFAKPVRFSSFKIDPFDNTLTGCPLDEKISEMQRLKRDGYTIAALAMIMIDNPNCPLTGHRICNDCMKACIYQKQEPVNIPQIETRILTDVLSLPWGIEIYDLLTRWHPLRQTQYLPKPHNGLKILIAGMGPAGLTLAHHLLMEGFTVVGIDGLKIEPLPEHLIKQPIEYYTDFQEELDERIMTGFGGVAEYGITVRWDKNFLKLVYLSLLRRPHFQVYGAVRFGGTLTVEDAWDLGFDHIAIAVGAGLPQALPIPGSLAPGMRQAVDFLMTLQLTGAAKENSLANLQVRLPAIVIGGGLTGIDTATEVQAYYLIQIEKIRHRYEQLIQVFGETRIHEQLDPSSREILEEFLSHAKALEAERERAAGTEPDIQSLLHQWGGVTVAYRRSLQDSPAYQRNHEEIIKALEEGIFYLEALEPKAARLDQYGQIQTLVCQKRVQDAEGNWQNSEEEIVLPARAIFVATGAKPNVAYEFEHKGHFERHSLFQYQPHHDIQGRLQAISAAEHCKIPDFGPFTSYEHTDHRITFIGDTHPAFHGSVVKAVASGMRTYPHIVKALSQKIASTAQQERIENNNLGDILQPRIEQIQRHSPNIIELHIRAPLAAKKYQPGQFFRLQNYETQAPIVGQTRLQTEALALRCAGIDREKGLLSFMILEQGASSRLCATFRPGQPIALMGPTGVPTKIDDGGETIMIIGGPIASADIRTLGPALRNAGNRVLYIAHFQSAEDVYNQAALEAAADAIVWITASGKPIPVNRPQDCSITSDFLETLTRYAKGDLSDTPPAIPLQEITRVHIIGSHRLVRLIQQARQSTLRDYLTQSPQCIASIHGPMQCMLKGVCAQCLQWQIDPKTKKRTKAVFACSWQDQPLDMVDIDNLDERLSQNRVQEVISNLWLDYLFEHHEIERV